MRVVVDIGLHLGLAIPADVDPVLLDGVAATRGGCGTASSRREFLRVRALQPDGFAASEVDRYLGLPGPGDLLQGRRAGVARRRARTRGAAAADGFDLKAWHMKALALGSVGLDVLRDELARA